MANISEITSNIVRIKNEINENKEYQELRQSIGYNHCRISTHENVLFKIQLREEERKLKKHKKLSKRGNSKIVMDPIKQPQTQECSICFENHSYNDLIKTSCGHYFGHSCYNKWIQISVEQNEDNVVTCPYCRTENPSFSQYKEKYIKNKK